MLSHPLGPTDGLHKSTIMSQKVQREDLKVEWTPHLRPLTADKRPHGNVGAAHSIKTLSCWLTECLGSCHASQGVLLQQSLGKVLSRSCDGRPRLFSEIWLLLQHLRNKEHSMSGIHECRAIPIPDPALQVHKAGRQSSNAWMLLCGEREAAASSPPLFLSIVSCASRTRLFLRALPYLIKDALLRLVPEGPPTTQEDVGNDAHAPHITLRSTLSAQHLGSYVVRTAHHVCEVLICSSTGKPGCMRTSMPSVVCDCRQGRMFILYS